MLIRQLDQQLLSILSKEPAGCYVTDLVRSVRRPRYEVIYRLHALSEKRLIVKLNEFEDDGRRENLKYAIRPALLNNKESKEV